jgi:predicted AlkP superfamily pyrophosphatase or phosphodiesterase
MRRKSALKFYLKNFMQKNINIFIFIDALGWEIIKDKGFLEDLLPYRNPVQMQFGYSSTALPTILTGKSPAEHKHLSLYYYAPDKSPFKIFRHLMLHHLPSKFFDRWRVRHILSKMIAKTYGDTGYFEMYAMPFDRLHYFDYIEKTDIFIPGGLSPVPNLADKLIKRGVPYHISNWRRPEIENIDALILEIEKEDIRFAFLYTATLDALLHLETKDGKSVPLKLEWYSRQINRIVDCVKNHYRNFTVSVISDHGMTTLTDTVDVKAEVEMLPLKFGKDYAAVYDSTMARFWFFNNVARQDIIEKLQQIPHSHILSEKEKIRYRIDFPDNMYGETFLLMDPGVQIEPSDMGRKALPGMHGFAPEHEDSCACFLSSVPADKPPQWVGDFHRIMVASL